MACPGSSFCVGVDWNQTPVDLCIPNCDPAANSCAGGLVCVPQSLGPHESGYCTLPCTGDAACNGGLDGGSTGFVCASGVCKCTQDSDCSADGSLKCEAGTGVCYAPCGAGLTCTAGCCATEGATDFCDTQAACPAPSIPCGAGCIDPTADNSNCGSCGNPCGANEQCLNGQCTWQGTNIQHVVLIVQENHTFDSYYGAYCTAAAGSEPTCTGGPGCCEAAPATDPNGNAPSALTDSFNYHSDHDHGFDCEICEINGGAMDKFTAGGCPTTASSFTSYGCSVPENFAVASDSNEMATYWGYADAYALADRYFQPTVGSTSSNDMYFAVSHYEFLDNDLIPDSYGATPTYCVNPFGSNTPQSLPGRTTIGDVLLNGGYTFKVYADGYQDTVNAAPSCPSAGGNYCHETFETSACKYDPSDIPFQYYPQFTDQSPYIKDLAADFFTDVSSGNLPHFAYVKYRTADNEHPNFSYITDGENNVDAVVSAILNSPTYASNTLILLAWDEGGGFYDHVAPPPSIETYPSTARSDLAGTPVPYGTRVPFLALGPFAKQGYISHVQMEHSSVIAFLEWNFLGPSAVGAIHATTSAARDGQVNGLGSLLDATAVGATPP
jgi:phospholipase C